ncbi:MAG: Asp-tRNA(Asn)/Glu-tRNA(Gln) amidotransferase subunit GatB [Armatimonadetes bacterium]|nr:Asp-tRNA(Asn)/Glu-tRNA(Gln) amidotransferase subunit GatB [Armatimonadota bacterium]
MNLRTIIGLEIHVELATKTKLFCGCLNIFGSPPNTNVCPVCLGLPGALPAANKQAVLLLIKSALALNSEISLFSKFDRKNYFYPDMPKNYQISQYDLPLAKGGYLAIKDKKVNLKRIHLEEDTGKSTHLGMIDKSLYTLEDYNRAGVPLMEIVTEPDLNSEEEAYDFLVNLRKILEWIGVSDCKMEEGSLRCDANISLSKDLNLSNKVEIKNMNSFKIVEQALNYEIKRQREILEKGEKVKQETRGWDEKKEITIVLRSKEEAHDYRYFTEPDLPPIKILEEWIDEIKYKIPELPQKRIQRFIEKYNLNEYDAKVLNNSKVMSDFFEDTLNHYFNPKEICNWLMGDIAKYLNSKNLAINQTKFTAFNFSKLLNLINKELISGKIAKNIIEELIESGNDPEILINEKGLGQITDYNELLRAIFQILEENMQILEEYLNGKEKVFSFLVGKIMQKTKGRANPKLVNQLLKEELEKRKKNEN